MIQYNFKSLCKVVKINNSYQDANDESVRETHTSECFVLFCFHLSCKEVNYTCFIFN